MKRSDAVAVCGVRFSAHATRMEYFKTDTRVANMTLFSLNDFHTAAASSPFYVAHDKYLKRVCSGGVKQHTTGITRGRHRPTGHRLVPSISSTPANRLLLISVIPSLSEAPVSRHLLLLIHSLTASY